jgi:hypothetical protein
LAGDIYNDKTPHPKLEKIKKAKEIKPNE